MFQVMQSVVVIDEELESHGQAGTVVNPHDENGKVVVRMDVDSEELAFEKTALRTL